VSVQSPGVRSTTVPQGFTEFCLSTHSVGRGKHTQSPRTSDQAESCSRPLRRRAAMIARPARVRIRNRKPWVLALRRLFGWKVRLLTTDSTIMLSEGTRTAPGRHGSRRGRRRWIGDESVPAERAARNDCCQASTRYVLAGWRVKPGKACPRKLSSTPPTDCSARPTGTVCPRTPISAFCNLSSADRQGVHPVHHGKHDRLWSCPAGSEEHATRRYCGGSSVLRTHGQGKRPHGTIRDLSESRTMPKVAHRLWINMWTMGPYRGSFRGGG
jgi:hypothetical protein